MVSVALADVDRLLAHAERATSLIGRCLPVNAAGERERVATSWSAGKEAVPEWRYRAAPDLTPLLGALDQVASGSGRTGSLGALYAARAAELWREAAIVSALGAAGFPARAAARFPVDASQHGLLADRTSAVWAALPPAASGARSVAAEHEHDPESLVSVLRSLVGALRLPVRVVATARLASAAATGDGFIVVRSGVSHRPATARRIAAHEVHGHALPRVRARSERLGLFAVGTMSGPDDEEGRALLIEERHGLLDDDRCRELGVRHLAARAVRGGADWVEVMRLVLGHGASVSDAVGVAARVSRGGGLARELVYLPALHRVRAAFEADPEAERWLERGRVAVGAIPSLRGLGGLARERLDLGAPLLGPGLQRNVATTGV
jgi:hypothetical protein